MTRVDFLKNTLLILCLPMMAMAASEPVINSGASATIWPLFVSLDATSLFAQPGDTQEINLYGGVGDTYVTQNQWENNTTFIVGLGVRLFKNDWLQVNTSVRYLPMTGMQVEGDIWQFNSPEFDNLAYHYQVKSDLVFLDNVISWTRYPFQPGVIIGLGRAYNTVDHYQEWPLNNTASESISVFADNKNQQFAYEVGAVLDYSYKNFVIEAAYRFIDAGQGELGLSSIQNTTQHLTTGNLYYQTVSLGIRLYYEV